MFRREKRRRGKLNDGGRKNGENNMNSRETREARESSSPPPREFNRQVSLLLIVKLSINNYWE